MTIDRYLRMIAGAFVLLTLALGYWVSPYGFLFTARDQLPRTSSAVSGDDDPPQIGRPRQLRLARDN